MSDIEKTTHPDVITAASLRDYWRSHNAVWADVDLRKDPGGLANVCHAGAPYYVNQYAAKCQHRVFDDLLARVPLTGSTSHALDVGCGAGRWSTRLARAGFSVTGIDLQPELLDRNRREYPGIEFVYTAVQDFEGRGFDLVNSVTVIQHNPEAEQVRMVRKIREVLRPGGHALIMENIVDRLPTVFARTADGWRSLFEANGFRCVAHTTYDYRSLQRLARRRRASGSGEAGPRRPNPTTGGGGRDYLKRLIVTVDTVIEPLLVATQASGATHCGFLFRAE